MIISTFIGLPLISGNLEAGTWAFVAALFAIAAWASASIEVRPKLYPCVIVQLVQPDLDDSGDNRFYIRKEIDLPFIPDEKMGFIFPDLGDAMVRVNWVHYDFRTERFYVTIHTNWVEEWDGTEYDWDQTKKSLYDYIDKMKAAGWEVIKKPYEEI